MIRYQVFVAVLIGGYSGNKVAAIMFRVEKAKLP